MLLTRNIPVEPGKCKGIDPNDQQMVIDYIQINSSQSVSFPLEETA